MNQKQKQLTNVTFFFQNVNHKLSKIQNIFT